MSEKKLRLICPNLRCRALLAVPETLRGQRVRCRNCNKPVMVPATGGGEASSQTTKPAETSAD